MPVLKEIARGIPEEKAVLVCLFGLCPALASTTSAFNGLGMAASVVFVLVCSSLAISLLEPVVAPGARIPCAVTVIATFVTIVDLVLHAFVFQLWLDLGIYVPLLAVSCFVLCRVGACAERRGVLASGMDALGMGLGFTLLVVVAGAIREILGSGTLTIWQMGDSLIRLSVLEGRIAKAVVMILPPGAFLTIGTLLALRNLLIERLGRSSLARLPAERYDPPDRRERCTEPSSPS